MPQVQTTKPLRVALIGAGKFAAFIASSLQSSTAARLVAVADPRGDSSLLDPAKFGLTDVQHDVDTLINDPTIDAIHIVTPPNSHAQLAIKALQAGKHVVVEKPLALTPETGAQVVEAAITSQRVLAVGHILRYNPIIENLRILIRDILGPPHSIAVENIAHRPPEGHWFWDISQSGGINIEHGVHFFDSVAYILNSQPKKIGGSLGLRDSKNTDASTTIIYPTNTLAHFYHGFLLRSYLEHTRWLLVWDNAKAIIDGWMPQQLIIDMEVAPSISTKIKELGLTITPRANAQEQASLILPSTKDDVYAQCIRDLWQDVAHGITTQSIPLASGQVGLDSLNTAWHASQRLIHL